MPEIIAVFLGSTRQMNFLPTACVWRCRKQNNWVILVLISFELIASFQRDWHASWAAHTTSSRKDFNLSRTVHLPHQFEQYPRSEIKSTEDLRIYWSWLKCQKVILLGIPMDASRSFWWCKFADGVWYELHDTIYETTYWFWDSLRGSILVLNDNMMKNTRTALLTCLE